MHFTTAFFNKKKVAHFNEDVDPRFKFVAAWEVLQNFPKFNAAEKAASCEPTTNEMDKVGGKSSEKTGNIEPVENRNGGTNRKISKVARSSGRQRSKELRALEEHRSKKVKMVSESLELQRWHLVELDRHNDIQLFTSRPGGADSEMATELFRMKKEERLAAVREKARKRVVSDVLDVLEDSATDNLEV